jgi:hypothetical protein
MMWHAGLLVEDRAMPGASKLLKVGGNGLSVPFLAAFLLPLEVEGFRVLAREKRVRRTAKS